MAEPAEGRYLSQRRPARQAAPADQLDPRAEASEDRGTQGRVLHESATLRRRIPLAKKWFMGHNVQAGETPLVETYPAGLRNRRLWCVLGLVAVAGILFFVAFVMTLWLYSHIDLSRRGADDFIIRDGQVRFTERFEVNGDSLLPGPEPGVTPGFDTSVEGVQRDNPDFRLSSKQALTVAMLTTRATNKVSLDLDHRTGIEVRGDPILLSPASAPGPGMPTAPFMQLRSEALDIDATRVVVNRDLTAVRQSLSAARFVSPLDAPLAVVSSGHLNASATRDIVVRSTAGSVVLTGATGVRLEAFDAPPSPGVTNQLVLQPGAGSHVTLDIGRLGVPTAAAAQSAFAVCACASGRLYLMPAASRCAPTTAAWLVDPCSP